MTGSDRRTLGASGLARGRRSAWWSLASAAALTVALAAPARAQDHTFDEAVALLNDAAAARVEEGIQALGLMGDRRAVAPLSARIRGGLPPALLVSALDTLTVIGHADAGPVLFELAVHRRPEIRLRAVQAIAACRPRGGERALISGLGDSSAEVRAASATALGELRAADAIPTLFLAFERDVPEAGVALGRLVRPEHIRQVLSYLGRVSFATMRLVLAEVLVRRDLGDRPRLDVIAALAELATGEVRTFLEETVGALPAGSDAVRRAAQDAITRIAQ